MLLIIIGGILFISVLFTGIAHFGDFSDFEGRTRDEGTRAIIGMVLMIIGGIIRGIGSHGLAGSGAILDPEQAREDLEPYSRQVGGMVKDVLDEADIDLGNRSAEKVVVIKCQSCGTLNDEDAMFCKGCGKKISQ